MPISITPSGVLPQGTVKRISGLAGVTILAGRPIYRDVNGVFQLSTAATATSAQCDGIAMSSAAAGQPIHCCALGSMAMGATLSAGMIYCVGTSGGVELFTSVSPGDFVTEIGYAEDSTYLVVGILQTAVQLD